MYKKISFYIMTKKLYLYLLIMHFLVDGISFIATLSLPFLIGFTAPNPYNYIAIPSSLLFFLYPVLI